MSSSQKIVIVVAVGSIGLRLLFPPWECFDPMTSGRTPCGYHFFAKPPQPDIGAFRYQVLIPELVRVRKNNLRLIVQLAFTIPLACGLILLLDQHRRLLGLILGIGFLAVAGAVLAAVIWAVVLEKIDRGVWVLP
jgi:hypothetical protein